LQECGLLKIWRVTVFWLPPKSFIRKIFSLC